MIIQHIPYIRVLNKSIINITTSELPNHISLILQLTGCCQLCAFCHTPELRHEKNGEILKIAEFNHLLEKYKNKISGVVFLGGEWFTGFTYFLQLTQSKNLKTCLYTGRESIDNKLLSYIDYIKYGEWISEKGGLDNKNTNQRFIEVKTGKKLNHLFHRRNT